MAEQPWAALQLPAAEVSGEDMAPDCCDSPPPRPFRRLRDGNDAARNPRRVAAGDNSAASRPRFGNWRVRWVKLLAGFVRKGDGEMSERAMR
jgi:hypothetical protein